MEHGIGTYYMNFEGWPAFTAFVTHEERCAWGKDVG